MDAETPKAVVYLLLVAGFLAGFLVRQFSKKFIEFLKFNVLRAWMKLRAEKDAIFEFDADLHATIRYVSTVKAVGAAMVKQYSNAQSVVLFMGDCDFLDYEENEALLHRLEELSNHKALSIVSSERISPLKEKYNDRSPRRQRILALLTKISDEKRFKNKTAMVFRGSFVDYGVGYSIYRFQTISSTGSIYPAIITNISSSSVLQFANKESAVKPILDMLTSERFIR